MQVTRGREVCSKRNKNHLEGALSYKTPEIIHKEENKRESRFKRPHFICEFK
jgi:hypothetical protein